MFDKIYIGIGYNSGKHNRYFNIDLIVEKINATFKNKSNVEVIVYNELTAELAKKLNAKFLLRGLRNTTDFEYENSISQVNRKLNPDLDSVFLITSPKYAAISSSIIREVHKFGGEVKEYLPYDL